MNICNLTIHFTQLLLSPCFWFPFSLFSLLFLSFSRLPNTPFEDDNSNDVWLSLKTLKRRVARLVDVGFQVFLCFHEACTAFLCFKLSKLLLSAI